VVWFGLASNPEYISTFTRPADSACTCAPSTSTTSVSAPRSSSRYASELAEQLPAVLEKIYLDENPISEAQSTLKKAIELLTYHIPSLKSIDSHQLTRNHEINQNSFNVIKVRGTTRIEGGGSNLLGAAGDGGKMLDTMEAEYLAALKGHKDVIVIS
jgi:hypothetical protein